LPFVHTTKGLNIIQTIRLFIFLSFLLLLQRETIYAEWQRTSGSGPHGGNVNALVVSGTNLFAGTGGGGVFRSTDNGISWTEVNSGLTTTNINALVVSGINLFAGTDHDVFLSTNNGTSWAQVNSGLTNTDVSSLAVSAANDGFSTNIFAGTWGRGIFLSTNNGTSWTQANSGLTNTIIGLLLFPIPLFLLGLTMASFFPPTTAQVGNRQA
jgi:hypothetical protein